MLEILAFGFVLIFYYIKLPQRFNCRESMFFKLFSLMWKPNTSIFAMSASI